MEEGHCKTQIGLEKIHFVLTSRNDYTEGFVTPPGLDLLIPSDNQNQIVLLEWKQLRNTLWSIIK